MATIRKASFSDLDKIIILDKECFGKDMYTKMYWEQLLNITEVFVAVDTNNKIIGSISIIFETFKSSVNSKKSMDAVELFLNKFNIKKYYLIVTICVDCLHRSSGIGSKLLQTAIKEKTNPVLLNVRESNAKAIKFYEKHGFHKTDFVDKNYYDNPKENALLMCYEMQIVN